MAEVETLVTLARAEGSRGEIALRRRTGPRGEIDELIVNGTFAMDSAETSTELALAGTVTRPGADVLVGGLGLGFTTAELLRLGARSVDVVEIEPQLVVWARESVTAVLGSLAADSRVRLYVADIAEVLLAGLPGSTRWDAILLDVDNGPDFLIHDSNARIYEGELLAAAAERLSPGGVLAVWCQGPAPGLAGTLSGLEGLLDTLLLDVVRDGRPMTYAIYTLTR